MTQQKSPLLGSVGIGGTNIYPDVLTVKGLLNSHLYGNPQFRNAALNEHEIGVDRLRMDGGADRQTKACIRQFQQTVMCKPESWADGLVEPGKQTWRALVANIPTMDQIRMMRATPTAPPAPSRPIQTRTPGGYSRFAQSNYRQTLGTNRTQTISAKGCCLCTLTMAATAIGRRTENWPQGVMPRDLTPPAANQILGRAGAYDGYKIKTHRAPQALGMTPTEYGWNYMVGKTNLPPNALQILRDHVRAGLPAAAHVDYHGGQDGDHWVLITRAERKGLQEFEALDPSSGGTMGFTSNASANTRYSSREVCTRKAILFGLPGTANPLAQQASYSVVRFILLSPLS